MRCVPSRFYPAVMATLGLALACILLFAAFSGGGVAMDTYASRNETLVLPHVPRLSGEINVNTADAQTLSLLPGIGEITAQRIIAEREQNGPFHFPGELLAVYGIGEKKLAALLPHIRLDDMPQ